MVIISEGRFGDAPDSLNIFGGVGFGGGDS